MRPQFRGASKPLIAGATLCTTIEGMYGSDIEQWVGKLVTLYPTTTDVGPKKGVPCIRIRPSVPRGKGEVEMPKVDVDPECERNRMRLSQESLGVMTYDEQANTPGHRFRGRGACVAAGQRQRLQGVRRDIARRQVPRGRRTRPGRGPGRRLPARGRGGDSPVAWNENERERTG